MTSQEPSHPYVNQHDRAFWRQSVSEVHWTDFSDLWRHPSLTSSNRFATAGSCFAQHIGRFLANQDCEYLDLEPRPSWLDAAAAAQHGFGTYSCRYGNIYSTRQLRQLMEEAYGDRVPSDPVWERDGRWFDAMRPFVDPVGHASPDIVLALRAKHLDRVREMFATLDVFVFTLGLTEAWESTQDETVFPSAPGIIAGTFNSKQYRLRVLSHSDCLADLEYVRSRLLEVNPGTKIVLTVSPVPLVATATDDHVLPATVFAKSTLRSVAGEMASNHDNVTYFPSYEIIAAHPGRAAFFNADLRTVSASGVQHVMGHFFKGWLKASDHASSGDEYEVICDEEAIAT
jgi:hypothetical protein